MIFISSFTLLNCSTPLTSQGSSVHSTSASSEYLNCYRVKSLTIIIFLFRKLITRLWNSDAIVTKVHLSYSFPFITPNFHETIMQTDTYQAWLAHRAIGNWNILRIFRRCFRFPFSGVYSIVNARRLRPLPVICQRVVPHSNKLSHLKISCEVRWI